MMKFEKLSIMDANTFLYNRKDIREESKIIYATVKVNLAYGGANIDENYQIFTPEFIVRDMVNAIGVDEVSNVERTILEPTSGDGAFTTYILKLRMEKALENKDTFIANLLRAISTIYSVEMDQQLILKQRCNIYTLIYLFCKEHSVEIPSGIDTLIKYMICTNFIWGMTNIENPIYNIFSTEVVYKMPVNNKNYEAIKFPVWDITDDLKISLHYEEAEA